MPVWLSIVLALGGSAIISTVVGFILNHYLKKLYDKKDHDREELNKLHAMEEEVARKKLINDALAPLAI